MVFEPDETNLTFEANMNVPPENESALYAVGDVTVDHLFVIHDVKVIYFPVEGSEERQMGVCLPKHYNRKKDSWDNVVQLTKEQKKQLDSAVVQDLSRKLQSSLSNMKECTTVRVNFSNSQYFPTVAYADVSYRDMLTVKGVRILDSGQGDLNIIFPANQQKEGTYNSIFGMVSKEHLLMVEDVVRDVFADEYRKKTGKEYEFRSSDSQKTMSKGR